MSGHRRPWAVGAVATLALVLTGSASAATPQQIYRDLVDNGRLDRPYKRAELERAFNLNPRVATDPRPPTVRRPIAEAPESPPRARPAGRNTRLPFSALDAALLVAGGGPLLLIGIGLRRRAARAPYQAPVAGA
ncbi:MAG TPA: hypothetical protein VHH55_05955 [Gaiellaceae bacterium]|jgi:hypothetical protein|nr:hypothetical protein [Gaiellaceae bacterium]